MTSCCCSVTCTQFYFFYIEFPILKKLEMDELSQMIKMKSASITNTNLTGNHSQLFSVELHVYVVTEGKREIRVVNVSDVLSFSCVCQKCRMDIPARPLLESHMEGHLNHEGKEIIETEQTKSIKEERDINNDTHYSNEGDSDEADMSLDGESFADSGEHEEDDGDIKSEDGGQQLSTSKNLDMTDSTKPGEPSRQDVGGIGTFAQPIKPNLWEFLDDSQSVKGNDCQAPNTVRHELAKRAKPRSRKLKLRLIGGKFVDGDADGKPYHCTICAKKYKKGCALVSHIKTHGRETPTCKVCGREFRFPSDLKKHASVHTGEKQQACSVCGKLFRLKCQVTEHMIVHTGAKIHMCPVCGKGFSRKRYIGLHHAAVHQDPRQPCNVFTCICSICGKIYKSLIALKEHTEIVHEEKRYTCEICGKILRADSSYKEHLMRHNDVKLHLCSLCGKKFCKRHELKKHMRTHTGDKPYSCSECGKKFNQRCYFEEHMRIHSGEKPYECTYCGATFRIRAGWRKHLKNEHREMNQSRDMNQNKETNVSSDHRDDSLDNSFNSGLDCDAILADALTNISTTEDLYNAI